MRELDINQLNNNIQRWIRDYMNAANAEKDVVGLSGGIDSAVTAALCMKTLGNQKVFGLILPCESNPADVEDAILVAKSLRIKYEIIDLTPVYMKFLEYLPHKEDPTLLAEANLKARLRMVTLYYYCQILGNCLVAGTGNRAELAIGYFTKYGDGGVDFEPLGLLYKSEVRSLAKKLNIPEKIIEKAPSPGLWPSQTDEGEIGLKYDTIDEILYRIDNNMDFTGLDKEKVKKVKDLMEKAVHKLNSPPSYHLIQE